MFMAAMGNESSGGGAFDPAAVFRNWWEPGRAYTGTASDVTALPNLGLASHILSYSSNGPLATIVDVNGTPSINMVGGNTDAIFASAAAGAELLGGANQPFTIAGLIRFDSIASDSFAVMLDDGSSFRNFHFMYFRSDGLIRVITRDNANVATLVDLPETNEADKTFAYVASVRANGTIDVWINDELSVDAAAYATSSLMLPMTSLSFGGYYEGAGNPTFEMDGKLGALAFHPGELPRETGAKAATYLNALR